MTALAPNAAAGREAATDPRHAAVWRALADVLAAAGRGAAELAVVDAGGGSGGFAVPLAARGHRVTVVDPSQDSLAALARRAADAGVADRVAGRQGDLSELVTVVGLETADLLLCHAVLDRVDDPEPALAAALRVLRTGGWLSLLVAGRAGAVLARALAGRLDEAARILTGLPADQGPGHAVDATRRFDTSEVVDLVRAAGAEVVAVHGVRVFTDLAAPPPATGADGDREPATAGCRALPAAWAGRLADLEEAVSARPPYCDLAAQLHVLARRPPAGPPSGTVSSPSGGASAPRHAP
jgi:SAM-dependent methyltransferase